MCTIHQPGSDIFKYINRMILLKDGFIAYQGKSENAFPYFKNIGYTLPEFCNPFDFFVDTIFLDENTGPMLNSQYLRLAETEVQQDLIEYNEKYKVKQNVISEVQVFRRVSWFLEFYLILERSVRDYT